MKKDEVKLDLTNNLVNLSSSILKRFGVEPFHPSMKDVDELLSKHKNKKVVLFLFDAFGKVIVDRYDKDVPFFKKHVFKEMSSIYPPTTVAATDALLTDKYPIENGFVGWNQYFKDEDKYIDVFLSRDKVNDIFLEKDVIKTYLKPTYIDELINKANNKEIAKIVKTLDFKEEIDEFKNLDLFFNHVDELLTNSSLEFIYAYSTLPDHTMHSEGIRGINVLPKIKYLETKLKEIVDKHKNDTLFLLIADHGFIDINNINLSLDKELVSCLKSEFPIFSIEGRFASINVKEDKIDDFINIYNNRYADKFFLFSKEEIIERNILGEGEHFKDIDSILGNYFLLSYSSFNISETEDFDLVGAHAGVTKDEMQLYLMAFND